MFSSFACLKAALDHGCQAMAGAAEADAAADAATDLTGHHLGALQVEGDLPGKRPSGRRTELVDGDHRSVGSRPAGRRDDQGGLGGVEDVRALGEPRELGVRALIAFLGVGLAAQRFLREVLAVWPLKVLSLTLIACALASFAGAVWRDRAIRARLAHAEIPMMPRLLTVGIAALLIAISGLAATALLWA